jgi:hypothetical protein
MYWRWPVASCSHSRQAWLPKENRLPILYGFC